LRYRKKAENDPETIFWDPSGESFIIADTGKFIKILPKYFKTKNFASFVRQLNMYEFRKVKNAKGIHEFRHEKFKRGEFESIRLIRRKITEAFEIGDNAKGDDKSLFIEYNRIKRQTMELEDAIRSMTSQNKKFIEANRELAFQMYYSNNESAMKTRKILFLLFALTNTYTPELLATAKKALALSNISLDDQNPASIDLHQNVGMVIKKINYKLIFDNAQSDSCLDKLTGIFTSYLNQKFANTVSHSDNDWDEFIHRLTQEDMFPDPTDNTVNMLTNEGNVADELVRRSPFRPNRVHNPDKSPYYDKDSVLDLKSENFDDIDFLGNMSRKQSSLRSTRGGLNQLETNLRSSSPTSPLSERTNSLNSQWKCFK
jgi:hypothetical protein